MNTTRREAALRPFREAETYMHDRIESGIEANRKGTSNLQLTDREGKPLSGVRVRVRQTGHAFLHGANLFMLDEMETPEKNENYKNLFRSCFNLATLPFYWNTLEPEEGHPRYDADSPRIYRRPAPDLCLSFCEENGITPKMHCLNYEAFTPGWVLQKYNTPQGVMRQLEKRFASLATRYRDRIPDWEVTNETLGWETLNRHRPFAGSVFYDHPDAVEWSFRTAEKYFPYNRLIINDDTDACWMRFRYNRSAYFMQIERALQRGARIDAIGMQFHFFFRREEEERIAAYLYDPKRIYAVLDQYATFGRPVQITEITLPCYSPAEEDEAIQEELLRNLYSMWFSHPAVEAAIYWNTTDGYAYQAEPGDMTAGENYYYGGLVRFDGTPKPAYRTLKNLFTNVWNTRLETETDRDGMLHFRGFYGTYDLEIIRDGSTQHLCYTLPKSYPYLQVLRTDLPADSH